MSEETRSDPLADVINMLAAPIAGGIRTFDQFRRGVEELFRAVENVNTTMENLNEAAMRINAFLAEVEEPVRAIIPQVTRTVKAADEITSLMEGPVRATAPRIERIVETLGSPGFTALPNQLGELMQRLGPLAQLAENAGGLFGAFRMPGLSGTPKPAATPAPAPASSVDQPAVAAVEQVARASAKQPARAHKSTSKSPAKSSAAKSATPKSSGASKRAAKGATPAN
jgi:ABC-type transporter Mla subunit MlaD